MKNRSTEELLNHALKCHYEGKKVVSVDYVIAKLLEHKGGVPPDKRKDVLKT